MARPLPVSFGNQSNPGRHGQDGTGRLVNAYAEFAGAEGKTPYPIFAIEGLSRLIDEDTSTGVRGMEPLDGSIYAIAGQQVFKVSPTGSTSTLLGGMPGTGTVFMARNQNAVAPQLALVSEGTAKFIQADTLADINDPDLPPPNSVCAIGGYLVFTISDGRVYITGINDITVNALDFQISNQFPDALKRGVAALGFLWLFGETSVEIWANTGNADFPFQLVSGGAFESGTLSAASVATISKAVFWVDKDGAVQQSQGASPVQISHKAVRDSIQDEPDKANMTGVAYALNGRPVYILSGSSFTWAYDLTTGLWHERKSYQSDRWRGERHAKLGTRDYVGDATLGRIYQVDPDIDDEDGEPIVWEATTPIIQAGNRRIGHTRLDLDMVTGVGKNTAVATQLNPHVEMRYSDDGGKTHSKWRQADLGKLGEYSTLVKFARMGQASRKGRSYTVRSAAAVTRGLLGATLGVK